MGLYLKAGQNTVYTSLFLSADKIPLHLFDGWLAERNTKVGVWHERFALYSTVDSKSNTADKGSSKISDDSSVMQGKFRLPLKGVYPQKQMVHSILHCPIDKW
eukprot:8143005-Ditylum_brightwellii.AAC.1